MEHLYIVCYDIRDDRRWRRLYKTMRQGEWLRLSVFQCRLDKVRSLKLEAAVRDIMDMDEDHVLIVDLGPADNISPRVRSLGRPFEPIERRAKIF